MFTSKEKKTGTEELASKNNQIEKGTTIKGDVHTQGNIRIDGDIEGNIISEAKVVLGETCLISGNLKAVIAEISGEVKGIVEISEHLILKPSAVINGDIITNKMTVEPGAVFNGGCKMGAVVKDISSGEQKNKQHKSA
jgi:cytoskeletal protein CcmA (bactofilin family)